MLVITKVKDLEELISSEKNKGKKVGLVPTMGALHEGHISLVQKAEETCDFIVVSIFVNPTQFNNKSDLEHYPRTLETDLEKLRKTKCNLVFSPSIEEVYPEEDTRKFDFGELDKVMEGSHRPGHFNGVAQVVSKLFNFVKPHQAFFGLKDFQQLAIVKNMVEQLQLDLEIVPCQIVREPDGLAMSSRNLRLTETQRKNAVEISKSLFKAIEMKPTQTVQEVKDWVINQINKNNYLNVEYFDIVDGKSLKSINNWNDSKDIIGCIAVHCGEIRLIDNIAFIN